MRTDIVPLTASRLPIWLLISFISLMLLLAWLLGFHYPFLCCNILLELLSEASSSCHVVYAWLICGLLISPSTPCSVPARRADKVTYSQMIDIFIRRRECFKTLSTGIYLKRGILWPNTRHAQTHSSRAGRRPKFSLFALSISLKDRASQRWQQEAQKSSERLSWQNLAWGKSLPSLCWPPLFFCSSVWPCRFSLRLKFAELSEESSFLGQDVLESKKKNIN